MRLREDLSMAAALALFLSPFLSDLAGRFLTAFCKLMRCLLAAASALGFCYGKKRMNTGPGGEIR
jgi:hypothetical protein